MNNSVNAFLGWRINGYVPSMILSAVVTVCELLSMIEQKNFLISLQLLYDVQRSFSSLHTVSVLQSPINFLKNYKSIIKFDIKSHIHQSHNCIFLARFITYLYLCTAVFQTKISRFSEVCN